MLEKTRIYTRAGTTYRMQVRYGFDEEFAGRSNQAPYFSLTCRIDRRTGNGRWINEGGGSAHDEIVKLFPALKPLVKWHLTDNTGTPMHYIANGEYWAYGYKQFKQESYAPDPVEAFKSTVVFGVIEGEVLPDLSDPKAVREWLTARHPALLPAMTRDMEAAGVVVPVSVPA